MNVLEVQTTYHSHFPAWESLSRAKEPDFVKRNRERALAGFMESGFPDSKKEDWKNTNLDPFFRTPFEFTAPPSVHPSAAQKLKAMGFESGPSNLLVFVNGHFSAEFSSPIGKIPGLRWGSLQSQWGAGLEEEALLPHIAFENRPFLALNEAFFTDGLYLQVAAGKSLPKPLHVVYLSSNAAKPSQSHIQNLLRLEEDAQAEVVEHYWGESRQPYFTNTVTKVSLKKGARLIHTKIQEESKGSTHIGLLSVLQQEGSSFQSRNFSFGGALGRSEVETLLAGKKAECLLEGLTLVGDHQTLDLHTFVDHQAAECKSEQTFKAVADKSGTAIFDGRVLVRENAQKTDARQSNKNLELSREAKVYSKPQLQIYADDVKCSHGSATGQLDEEAIFYFQARGISREEAKRTLVSAFAQEMVEKVSRDTLKAPLGRRVEHWMEEEIGK
jgi:Fe-S cluster assembly protein SufD